MEGVSEMTIEETATQEVTPPIVVHETPIPDQLWALLRQVLPLVTAALVLRGYIENDIAEIASIIFGVLAPIVWGQLKTRLRAVQLATLERKVPDRLLTTKAKAANP